MTTEVDSQDIEQMDAELASWTAGALLKDERERRGLTEKQVADRLHITMHYVRAIEADTYEKLPGLVFARGYIKSYALLLGLNPDQLVSLFDTMTEGHPPGILEVSGSGYRGRRRKRLLPWLLTALLAFLAGLLVFWAYNRFVSASVSDIDSTGRRSAGTAMVSSYGTRFNVFQGVIERDRPAEQAPATELVERPMSNPMVAGYPPIRQERTGQDLTEVVTLGTDRLQISFQNDGWVEVSDVDSVPIYRDLHKSGDLLRITGRAPFRILVGDAGSVTIHFNDKEISVEDNIRIDNTARLIVGI